MSTADFVPLLRDLIKSLRVSPEPADVPLLARLTAREMSVFFDHLAAGVPEAQTWLDVLKLVRTRYGTADDRRRQCEAEAQRGGLPGAKEAAARGAAARPAAAAGDGDDGDGGEFDAASHCVQCRKRVEDNEGALEGEAGEVIHEACLAAYERSGAPPCAECGKPVVGEYVRTGRTEAEAVMLHPGCVAPFRAARRPRCGRCGEDIVGRSYSVGQGGEAWHDGCVPDGVRVNN